MEAIKHLIKVPADRELKIRLPADAVTDTEAEVIVLFQSSSASPSAKLDAVREAMKDPLFLADLNEVAEDFKHADTDGKTL
jgi:hypothetical protein